MISSTLITILGELSGPSLESSFASVTGPKQKERSIQNTVPTHGTWKVLTQRIF
jgi:hypothetical protein